MILLDTQILLWAAGEFKALPPKAREFIEASDQVVWFSAASIWEIAIKRVQDRVAFRVDPAKLSAAVKQRGARELAVTGRHAAATLNLPPIHKDPFDRLLIAQAQVEELILLTADSQVARYPGRIVKV